MIYFTRLLSRSRHYNFAGVDVRDDFKYKESENTKNLTLFADGFVTGVYFAFLYVYCRNRNFPILSGICIVFSCLVTLFILLLVWFGSTVPIILEEELLSERIM